MSLQFLRVRIGPHRCGIPIADVTEVLRLVQVTPLPEAPGFLEGAVNVRGKVLPVMDLRRRFGFEPGPPRRPNRILVVHLGARWLGVIVDEVFDVETASACDEGFDPAGSMGLETRSIGRVVRHDGAPLIVLDPRTFLSGDEHARISEVVSHDEAL